jgi:AraC family transcriptional regulator
LAGEFGLSPGHFARKFRHSTGLSLQRFLNQRRIGRSCEMLREGSLALARIAIELGFSSQSHFTRLFSGLTGTSPQRFRRLQQRMGE